MLWAFDLGLVLELFGDRFGLWIWDFGLDIKSDELTCHIPDFDSTSDIKKIILIFILLIVIIMVI